MNLIHTPPTKEEALKWVEENPGAPLSGFACRYPGKYSEAADLVRKILRQSA